MQNCVGLFKNSINLTFLFVELFPKLDFGPFGKLNKFKLFASTPIWSQQATLLVSCANKMSKPCSLNINYHIISVLPGHLKHSGYPSKSIPGVRECKEHLPEVHTAQGYGLF